MKVYVVVEEAIGGDTITGVYVSLEAAMAAHPDIGWVEDDDGWWEGDGGVWIGEYGLQVGHVNTVRES